MRRLWLPYASFSVVMTGIIRATACGDETGHAVWIWALRVRNGKRARPCHVLFAICHATTYCICICIAMPQWATQLIAFNCMQLNSADINRHVRVLVHPQTHSFLQLPMSKNRCKIGALFEHKYLQFISHSRSRRTLNSYVRAFFKWNRQVRLYLFIQLEFCSLLSKNNLILDNFQRSSYYRLG